MRIIFVRHGHPDYKKDCLTELGHKQAEAAAKRLADERIDAFFSSSCGRAVQTCEHIAKEHGKSDITLLEFMREIAWGARNEGDELFANGHPWCTADKMVSDNLSVLSKSWRLEEPFAGNKVTDITDAVADSFDDWLSELGYRREGEYYRVGEPKYKTIVLTSHAGSSSAVFGRIFNLPFPFVCHAMSPNFTAITVIELEEEPGALISPRFELLNDARHIYADMTENIISN